MVVGGLTNNILAPHYVEKEHAEKVSQYTAKTRNISTLYVLRFCIFQFQVLHLTVAPPTLLRLTLEFISSNRYVTKDIILMAEFTRFFIRHLFPPAGQLELPSRYV